MPYSVLEAIETFNRPMTTTEVGRVLGYSRKTVDKMIDDGNLPCIQIPGIRSRKIDPRAFAFWYRKNNPVERLIQKGS